MAETTFGERVRAMRIERNLSQEGLAALLPKKPTLMWVSRVERGTQNVALADLEDLARALQVKPAWLVEGDAYQSEFIARLGGMEEQLDARGQRAVLATAEREVEESRRRADLSDEEAELVRLFRQMTPGVQKRLLQAAGSEEAPSQRQGSQRQAG